jgi:hypothetical protein
MAVLLMLGVGGTLVLEYRQNLSTLYIDLETKIEEHICSILAIERFKLAHIHLIRKCKKF